MEKFENLKKWIMDNGGFVHPALGIDISCPENRIIIANEKIKKDELILRIPKKLTICSDPNIKVDKNFEFIRETVSIVPILHNEFKKGEDSFYYPYLSMLNGLDSYKNHPHYVLMKRPDFEKEWKKISNIVGMLSLKTLRERIMNIYLEKNMNFIIDQDTVLYYHLLYMTRAWSDIGFVPFADLFQSKQTSLMALNSKLDQKDNITFYELVIDQDYEPNEVIYINYMLFDESILYCNFGFIDDVDEKRNDSARTIQIKPKKFVNVNNSELECFKEKTLGQFPMNKLFISSLGISDALHQYLRISNLTEKDFGTKDTLDILNNKIISIDNELTIFKSIFNFLQSTCPTEEMVYNSEKILSDSSYVSSSVEYNLAKITIYQKKIFNAVYKTITETWDKILNAPSNHYLLQNKKL